MVKLTPDDSLMSKVIGSSKAISATLKSPAEENWSQFHNSILTCLLKALVTQNSMIKRYIKILSKKIILTNQGKLLKNYNTFCWFFKELRAIQIKLAGILWNPSVWYLAFLHKYLFLRPICLEMWNEKVWKYPTKPNLAFKQDFLLLKR